jgi:hypothetical protein
VVYDLRPKLQVSYAGSMNITDPFAAYFTITNTGSLFALRNIDTRCQLISITTTTGIVIEQLAVGEGLSPQFTRLKTGESATVPCRYKGNIGGKADAAFVRSADIAIETEYSVPYWWTRSIYTARFIARWESNGTVHWTQEPIESR